MSPSTTTTDRIKVMPQPTSRPELEGIHHLKLPVADLQRSLDFYERVFGAQRIPEADHRKRDDGSLYAYILKVPGLNTMLELRLNSKHAQQQRHFDPFTLAVKDKATLELWKAYLDDCAIPHSPILNAIQAWVVVIEDPDEHRLRLYTLETHGPEVQPQEDDPWLQS